MPPDAGTDGKRVPIKIQNQIVGGRALLLAELLVAGGFLLFQLSPYARREAVWLLADAIGRLVPFVRGTRRYEEPDGVGAGAAADGPTAGRCGAGPSANLRRQHRLLTKASVVRTW